MGLCLSQDPCRQRLLNAGFRFQLSGSDQMAKGPPSPLRRHVLTKGNFGDDHPCQKSAAAWVGGHQSLLLVPADTLFGRKGDIQPIRNWLKRQKEALQREGQSMLSRRLKVRQAYVFMKQIQKSADAQAPSCQSFLFLKACKIGTIFASCQKW